MQGCSNSGIDSEHVCCPKLDLMLVSCVCAGYFHAPGASLCPLVGPVPAGITLPMVTMVFCSIDKWALMKVSMHSSGHPVIALRTTSSPLRLFLLTSEQLAFHMSRQYQPQALALERHAGCT